MSVLSENIRRLRNELGITQPELAEEFPDLSRSSVALWETDRAKPSLDNLIVLAKVFGVTLDELVFKSNAETLNHQKETIKRDLIAAWLTIEKTQKMTQQFNSWAIPERVEFLLTIDSVLTDGSDNDRRDTALIKVLTGETNGKKKTKPRKKTANKIVSKPNKKKRSKQN